MNVDKLIERLRKLHVEMIECANDLRALEDAEAREHGVELYGAAGIVIQWADKLEEEKRKQA